MITSNEAVDNFLNGKRNLAAFQFCQLVKESNQSRSKASAKRKNHNEDELAFNYAMVNLFTGCPRRASIIFSDLLKRYPRNPRLWLRLAESMLAAERMRLSEFEHSQQLARPHSRDHLIKTKNRPILIKINPNYCPQQLLLQQQTQTSSSRLPANFLVSVKSYLQKSLDLINEYNDISLLNDDIPQQQQQQQPKLHQQNQNSRQNLATESQSSTESGNNSILQPSGSIAPKTNLSSNNNSSKLSQQLSYANPYKSISRSALYHLRNKVQLNLAYVCLCMGEPVKALSYTTLCLRSCPQGYEKVMASLYHAEACILASRIDEAILHLNLEILNMAKSLSQDHPLVMGNTKRIVYGDEMQHQCDGGTLATIITYNLSVAYAAKGEFANAERILGRCIQATKPNPMQLIICLLYVQLQQGQVEIAKRTILSSLPQFR